MGERPDDYFFLSFWVGCKTIKHLATEENILKLPKTVFDPPLAFPSFAIRDYYSCDWLIEQLIFHTT